MHLFPALDELTDRDIHSRIAPRGTKPQPIEFRPGMVILGHSGKAYTVRGGGSDDDGTPIVDCDCEEGRPHRFSATTLARCIKTGSMWIR